MGRGCPSALTGVWDPADPPPGLPWALANDYKWQRTSGLIAKGNGAASPRLDSRTRQYPGTIKKPRSAVWSRGSIGGPRRPALRPGSRATLAARCRRTGGAEGRTGLCRDHVHRELPTADAGRDCRAGLQGGTAGRGRRLMWGRQRRSWGAGRPLCPGAGASCWESGVGRGVGGVLQAALPRPAAEPHTPCAPGAPARRGPPGGQAVHSGRRGGGRGERAQALGFLRGSSHPDAAGAVGMRPT